MPLHPSILHLPFSDTCEEGQWSVRSLQTDSGGTTLWGPLLFPPNATACEGIPFLLFLTLLMHKHEDTWILNSNSEWEMGNHLGLAVSSLKQLCIYQGHVKHGKLQ